MRLDFGYKDRLFLDTLVLCVGEKKNKSRIFAAVKGYSLS